MYKHILVPVDGSDLSNKAVDHCTRLAKSSGAKVTAIYVLPHAHFDLAGGEHRAIIRQYQQGRDEQMKKDAESLLDKVTTRGKAGGVAFSSEVVFEDSPYLGIIATAEKLGCDLVVMASHGHRGLNAVLLGSETTKVLTHSTVPVLVVR
jgi:nucleotide-binding universal stress UspA family protein